MSESKIETTLYGAFSFNGRQQGTEAYVVIPPPPSPANARAMTSCGKVRAKPHRTQPSPKMVYEDMRQAFLPTDAGEINPSTFRGELGYQRCR